MLYSGTGLLIISNDIIIYSKLVSFLPTSKGCSKAYISVLVAFKFVLSFYYDSVLTAQ